MTAFAAAVFLAMTVFNLAVGRSLLYPPAVFSGAWTGYLLWLSLLGDRFFPLSGRTLGVFLAGGLALSLGGLLVTLFWKRSAGWGSTGSRPERTIVRLLDFGFWMCLLAFPIRVLRLLELAGSDRRFGLLSPIFWITVRRVSLEESDRNRVSVLVLTDNIILLVWFLALASLAHDAARKRVRPTTVGLVALTLIYNLMTAGRFGALAFLLGLVAIVWITVGRLPWKVAAGSLVAGTIVFCAVAVFVQKGGNVRASVSKNAVGIWKSFELYGLGGIVAFDHTVRQPGDIPPVWTVTRSVVQVANKLGAHLELPSLNAEYSQVSDHERMNIYTMYFAYFPRFGWIGIAIFPFVVGAFSSWLFFPALSGDPRARLLFAASVAGLILSAFGEYFFMNLTFLLKAAIFSLVLYGLPRAGGGRT